MLLIDSVTGSAMVRAFETATRNMGLMKVFRVPAFIGARPGDVRGTGGDQGVRTGKEVLERSNTWPKVVLAQVF